METEKGVDQTTCPNCGAELTAQENADGSYSAPACSKCYKPATKKDVKATEQAAAAHVVTEKGVA